MTFVMHRKHVFPYYIFSRNWRKLSLVIGFSRKHGRVLHIYKTPLCRSEKHMQDSMAFNTKTGPIHLPKDGRPVDVQVSNLVKTFGKHEAVKGVSFTIGKGE